MKGAKLGQKLGDLINAFTPGRESGREVLYEGDSEHHHITVVDDGGLRTLCFGDEGTEAETSISTRNPESPVFEYPGMMLATLALAPWAREVLMIGLGGGYLPNLFRRRLPDYSLTVVELDLMVAELAATYFGFESVGRVKLAVADGRDYIEALPENSQEQIWLDAFGGNYIPRHLMTVEFLEICRGRLKPGGLLVQNLHQSQVGIFQDQLQTTLAVFEKIFALDGVRCGNAIVAAAKPGGPPAPAWDAESLRKAAKAVGPRVGPYDLASEMKKIKNFIPNPRATVLRDRP